MNDIIFQDFLDMQYREVRSMDRNSEILSISPLHFTSLNDAAPRHYVAKFKCKGLVYRNGRVEEAVGYSIGISLPENYLRHAVSTARILVYLEPRDVFHPNIKQHQICIGTVPHGAGLNLILQQTYRVLSWQSYTIREDDALNWEACRWARQNTYRFPVDSRPLIGRAQG